MIRPNESQRRTTDDERRTTDNGRRTTDDGRQTTDDGRRTDGRTSEAKSRYWWFRVLRDRSVSHSSSRERRQQACTPILETRTTPRSGGDRESFRGTSSKQIDFTQRSNVAARLGSRELRAVKIPAFYTTLCDPQNVEKTIPKNFGQKFHHRHLRF